ncbi:MAG: Kdo2-lipid lauroyltransferase/acyltransferase, partial [Bacteroidota bacterium]|nr:Kdo2-lipid lauroyltransferase/acyltransferase [Bacteroidota bacterium]
LPAGCINVQAIRRNEIVAMLADQSATYNKGIFVDLICIPSVTYKAPAALTLHYDIPILVVFAERMTDSTYSTKILEILHDDFQKDKKGIIELTHWHIDALEQAIRRKPELRAWKHRRSKHEPKSEKSK